MKRYIDPDRSQWPKLTERATADDALIEERVAGIISRVRSDGDKALIALSDEIDSVDLSQGLEVSPEEIEIASREVSAEL